MKTLPSAGTYLLLGAFSWGSASPKLTGSTFVDSAGFDAEAAAGSGALGTSWPRWGFGAVELLVPTPGLTFGFTLRRALRNMAEPGGPGRRPHGRSQPRAPAAAREGVRNCALSTEPHHQTSGQLPQFRAPAASPDLPPPPLHVPATLRA